MSCLLYTSKDKELAAFRNKTLGFVFQSFHLINSLNVLDNVELPLLYSKMAAKERTRLAKEVLDRVGLSHRMRHMPTPVSYTHLDVYKRQGIFFYLFPYLFLGISLLFIW